MVKFISAATAGYFIVLVLAYMRDGTLGDFISNFSFTDIWEYSLNSISSSGGEIGVRNAFYKYIENQNQFEGFNTGADYIRMMLFWLPTSWSFGIKPSDFAVTMGSAWLGYSQTAFSMHPTLYGECYANLNIFGVFLAIFWAAFSYILDRMIIKKEDYVLRCGLAVLVGLNYIMVARESAYNAFFTIMMGVIVLKVVSFCIYRVR